MGEENTRKWEGETRVEMQNTTPKEIWPLISDFCSLSKWVPHVKRCYLVEGVPNEVGMIRYCGTTEFPNEGEQWANEKLLMIDSSNMCFSYEILDNNLGFKGYVATVRLEQIEGEDGGVCGCRIVWSFVADPVDRFTLEDLVGFITSVAQVMAKRMEQSISLVRD
ncbi:lachrymatory-factor synthase-like [Silene latifolia]|uniref:lachrymatory-factor synthase-like n=1 Tax=Silene latifolia TaxID=37657 RepID=UPI003D77BECF